VDGEKANMSRGDFILTPNWSPHDHGNPGKEPVMWLDVLDMPTVNHFETSFMEHFDEKAQNTARQDGDSLDRYGSGVLPDGTLDTFKNRSPVINYTYARTKPIIERMLKAGDVDPIHGARVRYSNPVTGGHVMVTMGAYLALFPKGFKGKDYQSTDGTIFVCIDGRGSTKVGDKVLEWGPNDVFVVPPWHKYAHDMKDESVLFSISDKPAQEALGIWREKK
jgi:gentisate 1,2-dioxygenase